MKTLSSKFYFSSITIRVIVFAILLTIYLNVEAQKDTIFKNTIRFNITNPMIFGSGSLIFGYERLLKSNQSFSINIGRAYFSALSYNSLDTIIEMREKEYDDKGFHISGDYRFYIMSENKFKPPHGFYIGPYYSYNYFSRGNNWHMNSDTYEGDFTSDLTLNVHTAGIELGYQLILWKRLSVDFLFLGPGIGFYSIKTKLDTTLSEEDEALFFEALNQVLSENIPGYNRVIDSDEFKKTGTVKTTDFGYRYMALIGYRF